MTTDQLAAVASNRLRFMSTDDLADSLGLRAQSIRKRYCETGAYFCLRPVKLPNGRLMWPGDSVDQLAAGATK